MPRLAQNAVEGGGVNVALHEVKGVLQKLAKTWDGAEQEAKRGEFPEIAKAARRNKETLLKALGVLQGVHDLTPLLEKVASERTVDASLLQEARTRIASEEQARTAQGRHNQARKILTATVKKHVAGGVSSDRFYRLLRELRD